MTIKNVDYLNSKINMALLIFVVFILLVGIRVFEDNIRISKLEASLNNTTNNTIILQRLDILEQKFHDQIDCANNKCLVLNKFTPDSTNIGSVNYTDLPRGNYVLKYVCVSKDNDLTKINVTLYTYPLDSMGYYSSGIERYQNYSGFYLDFWNVHKSITLRDKNGNYRGYIFDSTKSLQASKFLDNVAFSVACYPVNW